LPVVAFYPILRDMRTAKLDRALAAGVAAVAVFNTLAALTMPVHDRRVSRLIVAIWFLALLAHSAAYWFGNAIRERRGIGVYLLSQAGLVMVIGLTGALFPVGVGLYIALTAEAVVVAGGTVGSIVITLTAIALFAANAMVVQDLYRGAMAGVLLAISGVVAHAVGALVRRPLAVVGASTPSVDPVGATGDSGLTSRELQVLRSLASGARNNQIATQLGIAERTVKAHLASIYQKLGVESRGAAVAAAQRRGLLRPHM
jgi:DNA-binding CsgD family transcriptional regulator